MSYDLLLIESNIAYSLFLLGYIFISLAVAISTKWPWKDVLTEEENPSIVNPARAQEPVFCNVMIFLGALFAYTMIGSFNTLFDARVLPDTVTATTFGLSLDTSGYLLIATSIAVVVIQCLLIGWVALDFRKSGPAMAAVNFVFTAWNAVPLVASLVSIYLLFTLEPSIADKSYIVWGTSFCLSALFLFLQSLISRRGLLSDLADPDFEEGGDIAQRVLLRMIPGGSLAVLSVASGLVIFFMS